MASNLLATASNLLATASNLLVMASNLSNLLATASNLEAMASNLLASACKSFFAAETLLVGPLKLPQVPFLVKGSGDAQVPIQPCGIMLM